MLSNALSQTLFSAMYNLLTAVGNAIGLRDIEDAPIDVGKIVGDTFESIAKALIGVLTVDGMKGVKNTAAFIKLLPIS